MAGLFVAAEGCDATGVANGTAAGYKNYGALVYLSTICRSASKRMRINSSMVNVSNAVPP
jgi:hypothetical protein